MELTGRFQDLPDVLSLMLKGYAETSLCYQITEDGKYCIGWCEVHDVWKQYPFDFDVDIVSKIIIQHLKKMAEKLEKPYCYGTFSLGFQMNIINGDDDIKFQEYGLISITPYWNYYGK